MILYEYRFVTLSSYHCLLNQAPFRYGRPQFSSLQTSLPARCDVEGSWEEPFTLTTRLRKSVESHRETTMVNRDPEARPLLPNKVQVTPLPRAQVAVILLARLAEPIAYTQFLPYINSVSYKYLFPIALTYCRRTDGGRVGYRRTGASGLLLRDDCKLTHSLIDSWASSSSPMIEWFISTSSAVHNCILGQPFG